MRMIFPGDSARQALCRNGGARAVVASHRQLLRIGAVPAEKPDGRSCRAAASTKARGLSTTGLAEQSIWLRGHATDYVERKSARSDGGSKRERVLRLEGASARPMRSRVPVTVGGRARAALPLPRC